MRAGVGLAFVLIVVAFSVDASQAARRPIASRPPSNLRAGDVWLVTVKNAPPQARFEIRLGAVRRSAALRKGKAEVVFPSAGTWSYGVSSKQRFTRLGTARVRAKRLALLQPFDIVEAGRWFVITDRAASAVYRVERATGTWRRVATVPEARELEVVDDHTVLVTSTGSVLRLDLTTGAIEPVVQVDSGVLGIARASDGALYLSVGDRVIHVAAGGARATILDGRNGIHGLTLDGDRLIVCESYAGNVLALDLASGRVDTLARGLGNPSFAVPVAGGMYLSEFLAGRISLLGDDGSIRQIAAVPQVGPIFPASDGTLLAVTLQAEALRIDPRTGRVTSLLP